jgi:hypothetical protein
VERSKSAVPAGLCRDLMLTRPYVPGYLDSAPSELERFSVRAAEIGWKIKVPTPSTAPSNYAQGFG